MTVALAHAHAHAHASFISTTTKPLPDSAAMTHDVFHYPCLGPTGPRDSIRGQGDRLTWVGLACLKEINVNVNVSVAFHGHGHGHGLFLVFG